MKNNILSNNLPHLPKKHLSKVEIGDLVASKVWEWLQQQKKMSYVPWVLDPKSCEYDKEKVIEQRTKDTILVILEDLILSISQEAKDL